MEIAHPPLLMKLYPKFEISEKTVSKDYSLERPRRTKMSQPRLRTQYEYLCESASLGIR